MRTRRHPGAAALAALLAIAAPSAQSATEADLDQLAADTTWLKLGHYERQDGARPAWHSTIHSDDFFLAADGGTNPTAELAATLAALDAPPGTDPDQHAQCRFPARLHWLRLHLGDRRAFRTDISCPGFQTWTRSGSVASVSVILATGFLGNPASYYGHTLLKFNFRDSDTQTTLLDESASYGAIMDGRNDNPVVYILKSLTRGYDAGFSHIRFYFHEHNYGNHELRDLWEYRLDLSDSDRDLVVAHTWELLGKRYTYEFFHGNCALRMAEVIELAAGLDVTPQRPWIIPQALAQKLASTRYQGRALVDEVIYHPSRQSRFYAKYQQLAPAERRLVRELATGATTLEEPSFQLIEAQSRQAILDTLLDYHQFVHNPLDKAPTAARVAYNAVLAERFRLPPGQTLFATPTSALPEHAHSPGWIQGSWRHNSGTGAITSLRARAAYYDSLDFASSHVRFGSLAMGDLQIDLLDQRLRISHLDVVRIESVNPGISGLPGDGGLAWKFAIGAEQARLACRDCLAGRLQADVGYTWSSYGRLSLGTYAGAALQTEAADQGWGFGRATGTLNVSLGDALRARLNYEYRVPAGTGSPAYGVATAELRWSWNRQSDLRLRYGRDRIREVGIGLGFYW